MQKEYVLVINSDHFTITLYDYEPYEIIRHEIEIHRSKDLESLLRIIRQYYDTYELNLLPDPTSTPLNQK